jgi:penicillin-binding protein 2
MVPATSGDRRSHDTRLAVMQYTVAGLIALLAVGFWILQVPQHQRYDEMAENNHLRSVPLRAPRGVLFDRNGKVLVENRYSFNISIVREQSHDVDASIRLLSRITGVDEAAMHDEVRRRRREPSFRPIVLIEDATLAQVASVAARRLELPGIIVQQVPTRRYPQNELAAHLIGYVGEVTENQLSRPGYHDLQAGAVVGQSGVEEAFNGLLMGTDGTRFVKVNSVGREIDEVRKQDAVEGRRIELTIDYDLQRAAEEGFHASGYNGAAVIMDPRDGEVLALVSLPAYDPNKFAVGIDRAAWNALNADKLNPLQDRAIQGRYSPGSTFKIAVAVAALEEGVVTPDFKVDCRGGGVFYGRYFRCWKAGGHGVVNMRRAIEESCNTYFYTLGSMLSIDQIHKWAVRLGLGEKTGISLPHENDGIVPSTEWKLKATGEKWYPGETISVAIGQGQVSVTPISLAEMISTVANGGTLYRPRLLKAIDNGHGWEPVPPEPPRMVTHLKPETVQALHDGLWMVVNGKGTGGRARIPGEDVAGKTGTAQVISLQGKARAGQTDKDLRDHGWFVFFAPKDHPEIAGVIFAEHAEHGALAAPIAKYVMETYFAKKDGRPLPHFQPPAPTGVAAAGDADIVHH